MTDVPLGSKRIAALRGPLQVLDELADRAPAATAPDPEETLFERICPDLTWSGEVTQEEFNHEAGLPEHLIVKTMSLRATIFTVI